MNNNRTDHFSSLQSLTSTLTLGFKFFAWINGLGVIATLSVGMGVITTDLAPQWLRLPLAAFLGGLTLAALGLLWSYPTQASLLNQLIAGRTRRTHWIPLFCTMVAYSLALLAFVFGCWLLLGLVSIVYQAPESTSSEDDMELAPFEQFGEAQEFTYDGKENTVQFF